MVSKGSRFDTSFAAASNWEMAVFRGNSALLTRPTPDVESVCLEADAIHVADPATGAQILTLRLWRSQQQAKSTDGEYCD